MAESQEHTSMENKEEQGQVKKGQHRDHEETAVNGQNEGEVDDLQVMSPEPETAVHPMSVGTDKGCDNAESLTVAENGQSLPEPMSLSRPESPSSVYAEDEEDNTVMAETVAQHRDTAPSPVTILAAEEEVTETANPNELEDVELSSPSSTPASESEVFDTPVSSLPASPVEAPQYPVLQLPGPESPGLSLYDAPARQPDGIPAFSPPQSPYLDRPHTPSPPGSPSSEYAPSPQRTPPPPVSPLTHAEASVRVSTYRDSMASIALSESSLDYDHLSPEAVEEALATPRVRASRHIRKPSSLEILQNMWAEDGRPRIQRQDTFFDATKDQPSPTQPENEHNVWEQEAMQSQLQPPASVRKHGRRTSSLNAPFKASDSSSEEGMELNWQKLDEEEELEKEEKEGAEGNEDESTAFLLARLEQENAKIASATVVASKAINRLRSESRPPSMGHLRKLVQDRNAPSIRYSLALSPGESLPEAMPEPPPMTELEFWAALVQDYPSTASRLPTLTTTKIRSGIPPPLRGVVWQSMAGARDRNLEDAFERLQHESSPYEGIINKDVGRSFPGVELFRDAEGAGQKMLGRVLKCYSLHDKDIGYCQGLGFLVGPLLMNMGERDAFCVLVRLMDHYSLRPSFLPSLSGLHMRIFQFSNLLKQHLPLLSEHFAGMGVEPAYLSQWFLSCFAVTCPLPMLFRIYDVIFAEGANETVMRVALALMRRNEQRMMESTEFEEIMQLLLGRGIWDCYGIDADTLVDDFTSLGNIITHARLAELEKEFEKQTSDAVGQSAGFLPDVQAAASRFLGRLWAPSHAPNKSTVTLSPPTAEGEGCAKKGTASFLRRSASKHSLSTLHDASGSDSSTSSGAPSLASTAATETENSDPTTARESQATDAMSFKSKADSMRTVSMSTGHGVPSTPGMSKEEKDMHGQIEDLLTALSEMQRESQQMAAMLQREREERGEDHLAMRRLVRKLRKTEGGDRDGEAGQGEEKASRRKTLPPPRRTVAVEEGEDGVKQRPKSVLVVARKPQQDEDLDDLVHTVNQRLESNARFSGSFETKAQLRSALTRTREQLADAEASSLDLSTRLDAAETSLAAFTTENEDLRSEVNELRTRVNEEYKARQKLELTIRDLRAEASSIARKERERLVRVESMHEGSTIASRRSSVVVDEPGRLVRTGSMNGAPGLRELRLGRRDSSSSVQSLRSMRTQRPAPPEIHVQTQAQQPAAPAIPSPPTPAAESATNPSPPTSAVADQPPASAITTPVPSGLSVPPPAMWHARTSSLATKEVLSTPQHEVMPEEALLLELVNAKTSEAQSRAEVDDIKRSLTLATRRHDAVMQTLQSQHEQMLAALQSQIAAANASQMAANASAEAARMEAKAARLETRAVREVAEHAKSSSISGGGDGMSFSVPPITPGGRYDSGNSRLLGEMGTPVGVVGGGEEGRSTPPPKEGKEKSPSSASAGGGGGGWFWNRRTPSAGGVRVAVTPPAE